MSDKYVGFSPQTNKLPQQDPIPLSVVERTDDGRIKSAPAEQDDDVVTRKQHNDKALAEHGVMTGAISSFAATAAPEGWLKANGAELLRADYPELWAYAQASGNLVAQASKEAGNFGDGDGSTTFTVPDVRGEFIRGFDDGRGADSGRAIGSSQSEDIGSHSHALDARSWTSGGTVDYSSTLDLRSSQTSLAGIGGIVLDRQVPNTIHNPDGENRPRNVALLYCIKY